MGGRGKISNYNPNQKTMDDYFLENRVSFIQCVASQIRDLYNETSATGKTHNDLIQLKKCHCCENKTLPINSQFAQCPLCGWIDDDYQNKHPGSNQGMNDLSLTDAKRVWHKSQNQLWG